MRTDEDDVLAAGEEVEREDAFEGGTVQRGGPLSVPVGERLEASETGAGESALDATALFVFELGGDDVFEQDGGARALAGGLSDEVVEVVGGAVEAESPEVRTLTEITLLCAERPKPQKTGSAWMHLATLYRSLFLVASVVVVVVSAEGIVGLQVMGPDVEVSQSGSVG